MATENNQTAIITGAAGGMGEAIARAFAEEGRPIILCDLHAGPLEELAKTLAGKTTVETVVGDVTAADYPARIIAALGARKIGVLAHAAGVSPSMADGKRVRNCSFDLHAGEVLGIAGLVGAGRTELLRLIRDGRLEWRAELPENQLADVAVGNTIELRYAGQVVTGNIRAVTPGVDAQTRTGTLYADLPTPGPLKPGVYVEGRIVTGDGQALTIPTAAIVQRDGHNYVFTVNDKQQAARLRLDANGPEHGKNSEIR